MAGNDNRKYPRLTPEQAKRHQHVTGVLLALLIALVVGVGVWAGGYGTSEPGNSFSDGEAHEGARS